MIELGLLGMLVLLVLVVSITLLRRYAPTSKDLPEPDDAGPRLITVQSFFQKPPE